MRAITFSEFGGPEVLTLSEVPDPEPGPGQIRIAVKAAGVNPIDWKMRRGMMGGALPARSGYEAAGLVDRLGEGVDDVRLGDRVFGFAAGGGLSSAYAPIPDGIDFTVAAGLPVAVEAAARTLDLVGATAQRAAGLTIVINGAAGAVGSAAVQLGRARGARVIGTASEANHDFLRELGAEPVAYGEGLADRIRTLAPDGVDGAIDAAGHGALPDLVALTGATERVVTIADYPGAEATGVRFSAGRGDERALYILKEIGPLLASGRFRSDVAATFPLAAAAEAHRASESGHVRGKLILLVD
jgi:NADPH:quinone reductase-like Zn-dependent oxidoreductase